MLFKRKSVGSAPKTTEPIEKEVRQRHRLSKPQTSKSSTNLSSLGLQQSAGRSTTSIQSEAPVGQITSTSATQERRFSEKPRPVSTVQEEALVESCNADDIALHGAAVVINAVDNIQTDRETASSVSKPRRPFSATVFGSRRTSNSHTASRNFSFEEAPRSREVSTSSPNAAVPVEVVIEGAPRVLERRASFTPGAATRLHKNVSREPPVTARKPVPQLHREPSYELASTDQLCEADKSYYYDPSRSPVSPLGRLEVIDFERDWEAPPQVERPSTPSDLDYHYLGGLRLGSLVVMNGRASPAPSELSRHLLHRPSALLRRDASSEYGSDIGSIKQTHTPPPSAWKRSQSREVSQSRKFSPSPRAQSDLSRDVSYGSENAFTAQSHAHGNDLPSPTADRTVSMAMAYIAEMPNSPFSQQRSPSPTGSVLRTTTKTTEHEAELFDDEAVEQSQGSEEDRNTISTCRTPSDAASHRNPFENYNKLRASQPQGDLQPPLDARGETSDSGYSSNASLQSMKDDKNNLVAQRVRAFEQPRVESAQPSATDKQTDEARTFGPRPFRNSIFKFHRKTAPELPKMGTFSSSTLSVATSQATSQATTSTSASTSRPKTPSKKLQKKRRLLQPVPPEQIMVMGAQSADEITITPIPQHQTANLMARSQQFPELQHTFKSMHHIKDSTSSVDQPFKPMEIRFPSPPPEPAPDEEAPRCSKAPSPKRDSFMARATRRQSLERQGNLNRRSGGIGEAEAQAVIQHFGNTASWLGGNPYDIAKAANSRPQSKNTFHESRITPHNITTSQPSTPGRRRLTMDDETASEFARNKSRSIAERDMQDSVENLKRLENEKNLAYERRAQFNDKGGVLGKLPRPYSAIVGSAPPISRKPLNSPTRPQTQQQHGRPTASPAQYWPEQQQHEQIYGLPALHTPRYHVEPATQQDQYHYEQRQQYSQPPERQPPPPQRSLQLGQQASYQDYESPAPLPPNHSPTPSFVEPHDGVEDISLAAPPPPSHSPRPMDLQTDEPAEDVWAAQAQAWKNRRKSVGEFLGFDREDLEDQLSAYTDEAVVEEDLYPSIPPRESQTSYTPHEIRNPQPTRANIWQPPVQHHATAYEPDLSRVTPTETFEDPISYPYAAQEQYRQPPRPLPKPHSRRASGHSQAPSYASSLAEELHPEINDRPQPPPDFGRYSGGLQYSYEKGKGFGGSAGTRTVSGKASGNRKSVPLSTEFGIDLSDVPIIAGMKRI